MDFTTIEAASCGIPILCEIDEDMEQYIPECPFLRTKPIVDNIESNLEYIDLTDPIENILEKKVEIMLFKNMIL